VCKFVAMMICAVFFVLFGIVALLTLVASNSTVVPSRPRITTEHK